MQLTATRRVAPALVSRNQRHACFAAFFLAGEKAEMLDLLVRSCGPLDDQRAHVSTFIAQLHRETVERSSISQTSFNGLLPALMGQLLQGVSPVAQSFIQSSLEQVPALFDGSSSFSGITRRLPVISDAMREKISTSIGSVRETLLDDSHQKVFHVELARALFSEEEGRAFELLSSNPVCAKELTSREASELIRSVIQAFFTDKEVDSVIRNRALQLAKRSYELLTSAWELTPKLSNLSPNHFSLRYAWIGNRTEELRFIKRINVVLSGGGAGTFIHDGISRAFLDAGIHPDLLIGCSAGAVAASLWAANVPKETVDEVFSPEETARMFSLTQIIPTLIKTRLGALIGQRVTKKMKQVFGDLKLSDVSDLLVGVNIQAPVRIGFSVFGRTTGSNGFKSYGSDIFLRQAVCGSAAIPGILPQVTVHAPRGESLMITTVGVNGARHPEIRNSSVPYFDGDDGAISNSLPVDLERYHQKIVGLDNNTLTIYVNLNSLNPYDKKMPSHFTRKEFEDMYLARFDSPKRMRRTLARISAFVSYVRQGTREWAHNRIAPLRAIRSYQALQDDTVSRSVEMVHGKGMRILVNANHDGRFNSLKFNDAKALHVAADEGLKIGRELVHLLTRGTFNEQ